MMQRKSLVDLSAEELVAMLIDRYPSQDGDTAGALEFYLFALEDCDPRALKAAIIGFFKGKFKSLSPTFRPTTAQLIFLHDDLIKDYEEQLRKERMPPPQKFIEEGSDMYRKLCRLKGRKCFPSAENKKTKVRGWFFSHADIEEASNIQLSGFKDLKLPKPIVQKA